MSKQTASRAWVCAFFIAPVLVVAIGLLFLSPAWHRGASVASTASLGTGSHAAHSRVLASNASVPLAFEQNQGQTDAQVQYLARGNGYTLFLTNNDAVFALHSQLTQTKTSTTRLTALLSKHSPRVQPAQANSFAVVHMQLAGANSPTKISAGNQLPGVSNYFLGNDASKWRTDVAHYARVSYQDVYPGITMAFHGAQRQVEFDFVVAPGANPAPIGFHFTGAQSLKTDDSGNLVIASAAGNVLLHKPVAYQEQNGTRQAVDARFILNARNEISFDLGNYDRSRELVIDPSVSVNYSTYLGGSGEDEGYGIAFDGSGNAYVTGQTASANFPGTTVGTYANGFDIFVTKIAADGSSLMFSTYVGGSLDESGNGVAVDGSGNAWVVGATNSTDFPVTTGAFQSALVSGSPSNAVVFELLSATGILNHSTYLGGAGTDVGLGIAVNTAGVYVTGSTSSSNFPLSAGALQGTYGGDTDAFVTKLNLTLGSPLLFSTYVGGSSLDFGDAIAIDSTGNAYVAGSTASSTNFPMSAAMQPAFGGGGSDAFVTAIKADGSAYIYSTYLGGSDIDVALGITVDSTGAYVTGSTASSDFPLQSPLQPTNAGNTDAFVAKLKTDGSGLLYSTYLGGGQFDTGSGIAVDGTGNAYITGQTASTAFPVVSATQASLAGKNDAFVTELNSTGSALVFSTYLGGSEDEDDGGSIGSIAVDSGGANIYVTGNTMSSDFPTGGNPPYTGAGSFGGGAADAFVAKYTQAASFTVSATPPTAVSPGASGTSTVTLTSVHGYSSSVTLSCSVSGGGSPAPACSGTSFSPDQVTPTSGGATSALTITTTPASASLFGPRKVFYATWLPIAGLSLVGMVFGSPRSRRSRLLSFLMLTLVFGALFLMPACGGSSSGGGGGGVGGTPAGSYTVTITGTGSDASTSTYSTQITLTVN